MNYPTSCALRIAGRPSLQQILNAGAAGAARMAALVGEKIHQQVSGNPKEPGLEPTVPLEPIEVFHHGKECILTNLLDILVREIGGKLEDELLPFAFLLLPLLYLPSARRVARRSGNLASTMRRWAVAMS